MRGTLYFLFGRAYEYAVSHLPPLTLPPDYFITPPAEADADASNAEGKTVKASEMILGGRLDAKLKGQDIALLRALNASRRDIRIKEILKNGPK